VRPLPSDYELKSLKADAMKRHVKKHIETGKREECSECGILTNDLAGHDAEAWL